MTPDWLLRIVPSGMSRAKLMLAGGLSLTALAAVAYDVVWLTSDEPAVHAGTAALEQPASGPAADAQAATTGPGSEPADAPTDATASAPEGAASGAPSGAASGEAAGAAPGATADDASRGAQPDWSALFAQLVAREAPAPTQAEPTIVAETKVAPEIDVQPVLAGFRLRGLVHDAVGGIALVNGHLLRVGDTLPGTDMTVDTIQSDRILLRVPGRAALVPLPLEPMHSSAAGTP